MADFGWRTPRRPHCAFFRLQAVQDAYTHPSLPLSFTRGQTRGVSAGRAGPRLSPILSHTRISPNKIDERSVPSWCLLLEGSALTQGGHSSW